MAEQTEKWSDLVRWVGESECIDPIEVLKMGRVAPLVTTENEARVALEAGLGRAQAAFDDAVSRWRAAGRPATKTPDVPPINGAVDPDDMPDIPPNNG